MAESPVEPLPHARTKSPSDQLRWFPLGDEDDDWRLLIHLMVRFGLSTKLGLMTIVYMEG